MRPGFANNLRDLCVLAMTLEVNKERIVPVFLSAWTLFNVSQIDRVTFEHLEDISQRTSAILSREHDRCLVLTRLLGSAFGENQEPSHIALPVLDRLKQRLETMNLSGQR